MKRSMLYMLCNLLIWNLIIVYLRAQMPLKSRRYQDLIADIEQGHISTAQMHLGNIAYRTGRKLIFDGKTEKFVNDNDANTYLARPGGGRKPYNIPNVV
ncbi:MAG TPA: hypothetical protein VMV77_16580 [Bacteroidales bacterium]|nr:hypothetical protein [Bacteroidales bacterium]